MHIALICDAAYASSAVLVLKSVLKASSPENIFVVDGGMRAEQADLLAGLASCVKIIKVPFEIREWLGQFSLHGHPHVSAAALLKLRLHDLVPVDKVLYLDTDLIVLRDVRPLFELSLGDDLVGATWSMFQLLRGKRRLGLQGDYFNTGVMLCGLSRWRAERLEEKFLDWYRANLQRMAFNDQEIFNGVCDLRVRWISKAWNVSHTEIFQRSTLGQLIPDCSDCCILHFNGSPKPWEEGYAQTTQFGPYELTIVRLLLAQIDMAGPIRFPGMQDIVAAGRSTT